MKEQLISFETAKLAKQKGFNINTYSNCWVKTLDNRIIHNSERKDNPNDDRCDVLYFQPTQSLLQKWLRDIHEIDITITICMHDTYQIYVHKKRQLPQNYEPKVITVTYENHKDLYEFTLEEALNEALNLI